MSNLSSLRQSISTIDSELLRLLDERMKLATGVAEYKRENHLPIIDEAREREILSKIPESYRNLWDEMIDISKNEQFKILGNSGKMRVAIQGGKGSFNEIAIRNFLDNSKQNPPSPLSQGGTETNLQNSLSQGGIRLEHENIEIVYAYTTAEVLKMVSRGEVAYGQFAIASSINDLVQETLDVLGSKRWNHIAHYTIPVKYCLMIHPDATIDSITTIMGHEQAVRECEQTLSTRFPSLAKIGGTGEFTDNASIAEGVANGKLPRTTASIGHESLATIYDLKIVERNIQDRDDNMTTFVLIRAR